MGEQRMPLFAFLEGLCRTAPNLDNAGFGPLSSLLVCGHVT